MNLGMFIPVILTALFSSVSRLPVYLNWTVFLAFVPLLYFFEKASHKPWHLLVGAALYSAFYVPPLLYWIAHVTLPGLFGIVLLYTLYFFITFYVIGQIYRYLHRLRYVGFVAVMISLEYIQNYGELRFAWLNLGYSLADYTSLIQFAELGGVVGLSILILVVNILIFRMLWADDFAQVGRYLIWTVLLFSFWLTYGWYCLNYLNLEKHDARIAVMQPSIEQENKWDMAYLNHILGINRELTTQAAKDSIKTIIWPEAAMPTYLMHYPAHQEFVQNLADRLDIDIFTGFPDYRAAPEAHHNAELYYNSAALFKPFAPVSEFYDKIILVPVAERTPWLKLFPFLWSLDLGQANWEYGTQIRYYNSGDYRFSPSICYEIAFADLNHQMAAGFDSKARTLTKSDYLVSITNDAWFGTSYGPWLHGVMTRFRAVENRIQIYRSANTGISMIVDPLGRELASTKLFERKNITAPLYKTSRIAPIRRYYIYPILIVGLAIILFVMATLQRAKGDPGHHSGSRRQRVKR